MRIVFMGTPDFAIPSLGILIQNKYDIAAVVTVPDKPAGRGLKINQSVVKLFALDHGLKIIQPDRLKDDRFIAEMKSIAPDVMVVVAFRILPPEIYNIPKLGSFNLHASLLPKYRGAAPINWAIIRGEKETGVTTFFLKESIDTGSIILQARTPIKPEETAGELHDKLAGIGAEIVLHTVRLLEFGKVNTKPQDDSKASTAPKIFRENCKIDWAKNVVEIHNLIRGLSPKPTAFTIYDDIHLKIYHSLIRKDLPRLKPGEILVNDQKLIIGTADYPIEIVELQQEGKKKLTTEEFLHGFKFDMDKRFFS